LPELSLPERKARFRPQPAFFAAASALLVLLFALWPKADDLTPKGTANVRVYWERAGQVSLLSAQSRLQAGDRVRAEVDPQAGGTAYWLVLDGAGKPLVDAAFVQASAVALHPGVPAPFAKSIQLVGPAAGETLHVVVCAAAPQSTEPTAILHAPGCTDRAFPLRAHD
jgi:hypothetical protein